MSHSTHSPNRRDLLRGLVTAGAAAAVSSQTSLSAEAEEDKVANKGRIQQSIAFWCFNSAGEKWSIEKTCQVAKKLGCASVELVAPEHWKVLKKHGLVCAMAPNGMPAPPFMKGFNNPAYHDQLIASTKKMIDAAAEAQFPNVIAFTGYKYVKAEDPKSGVIAHDDAIKNCVKGLKQVIGYAEKKKVTICMEHLNTRDDTHPMKGHPGYWGDNLDDVATIIKQVGSERMKLLFDVYHVQIMHGDVMRRLEENKEILGHIHTAGNPGRAELDDKQEIQYAPIMRKLVELKYKGYVGQEFIPTRDPMKGLTEAVALCDV